MQTVFLKKLKLKLKIEIFLFFGFSNILIIVKCLNFLYTRTIENCKFEWLFYVCRG